MEARDVDKRFHLRRDGGDRRFSGLVEWFPSPLLLCNAEGFVTFF